MKNYRLIVLTASITIAVALATISASAFFYSRNDTTIVYQPNAYGNYPTGMMGGYMGGMMSGPSSSSSSVQNPAPTQNAIYTILEISTLIGAVISGTVGLAYFLLSPRMRITEYANAKRKLPEKSHEEAANTPYMSISRTLTNEERKVLDVLVSHRGKYLQKYVRTETGMSRLKTHRIVARLAERGIVTLEKSGNTNEVRLSRWLQNSNVLEEQNHEEKVCILT